MPTPIDIYRSAHILIKQHGDNAEERALETMRKFMDAEDVAGASVWLTIAQAINKLQQETPNGTVH